MLRFLSISLAVTAFVVQADAQRQPIRPRAREMGIKPGIYEPGPLNAITDVAPVRVGQVTIHEGTNVRTGVTAIVPHPGNMLKQKIAAEVYVYNAFGKFVGATQVQELGQLETPILLTNTLSVWDAAAAIVDWELAQPGNEEVRSINPVVGETNDGWLNDIRGRHVKADQVRQALDSASDGSVQEGSVGGGTGTIALGWKGGIGTSSRRLPAKGRGYTVGVLVQTNFGGRLMIEGVPVWRELKSDESPTRGGGSCMIVVATDAPLDARQLHRLAARAILGMARTGSSGSGGSGDYVIAFSTVSWLPAGSGAKATMQAVSDDSLSPLFEAVSEATEEAIYNSLLRATTVTGRDAHVAQAIPIDRLREILHGASR